MAGSRAAAAPTALLFNLVFFTMVSSADVACPPPPTVPKPSSEDYSHEHAHNPTGDYSHEPSHNPTGEYGHEDAHKPTRDYGHEDSHKGKCPRDILKLGGCANLLGDLKLVNGTPCCTLIQGLVDLEAAVCLCTAIKANVLGINLNSSVSLSALLNYCGKKVPSVFKC